MIKTLRIRGLFGDVERNIDIKLKEDLSVLVGNNGCGKTTILNIMDNLVSEEYEELLNYKFFSIIAEIDELDAITYMEILNTSYGLVISKNRGLEEEGLKNNKIIYQDILEENNKIYRAIKCKKINNVKLYTIEKTKDRDRGWEEEFYLTSEKRALGDNRNGRNREKCIYFPTYRRIEIDFLEMVEERFFDSRRIYNKKENKIIGMSNNDINEILREKNNEITKIQTSKLNATIADFFFCFLKFPVEGNLDYRDIEEEKINIQLKDIFEKTGLAKNKKGWSQEIDTYTNSISKIAYEYEEIQTFINNQDISEVEESFPIHEIIERFDRIKSINYSWSQIQKVIEIYQKVCSEIEEIKLPFKRIEKNLSKFLAPKKVKIREGELEIYHGKSQLTFEDLSAGEKQLVTLIVYITLKARDNLVVIIDEPELSLHVNWQRELLQTLLIENSNIQLIIATHSPFISSCYRDKIIKVGTYDGNE